VNDPAGPYAGMAQAWAADATLAYGPLARHLIARLEPGQVSRALALDAGAGSGAAGEILREHGARVVAADREFDMAAYVATAGPAVTADVTVLPFRSDTFDIAVAAFVINHLADPVSGLSELRRVTRPGGVVLVSVFSDRRAAAKDAVDQVAEAHGFVRPPWYADMQRHAQAVGTSESLEQALAAAGFTGSVVVEESVDVGVLSPEDVVRYRLGMPHLHIFAASLSSPRRAVFVAEAVAAVAELGGRFAPEVLEAVAAP
jgi:ubiquinone/menaquinone biosynthesis C-methylase UbiE